MEFTTLDRRAVVHTVTQRFLRYALIDKSDDAATRERKSHDRQHIRALALLLKPDAELACALWDVSLAQGREILEDLAGHYSFIFAGYGPYEIHDLVHEFVRADTLAEGRNSFDWPALRVGLGRALSILEERIGQIKRDIVDTDKRYAHSAWREAILDRLNVLLWMGDEDAAKRVLLNRWIEARYAIPGFATSLTDLVAELAPKTPYWERLVQAVRAPEYGATLLPTGKMRIQFDQHDYSQLDDYVAFLETRSQAMLLYLRAQQVRGAFITSAR